MSQTRPMQVIVIHLKALDHINEAQLQVVETNLKGLEIDSGMRIWVFKRNYMTLKQITYFDDIDVYWNYQLKIALDEN